MNGQERRRRVGPVAWVLAGLVRLYQLVISPWLPPSCRFEPSCSAYALEALQVHGALRGGWLTVCRLGRCHPFCTGGYDPVPEPHERQGRWLKSHRSKAGSVTPEPVPSTVPDPRRTTDPDGPIDGAGATRATAPDTPTPTVGQSRKSPVASGSPDRGVPAC